MAFSIGLAAASCTGLGLAAWWIYPAEKRTLAVIPGRLIRGAWQHPSALRSIIARERIKTIVTLTAINRDDSKFVAQAKVVKETGVTWLLIPMRGSSATVEQMALAADLLAESARQPVFFHCVAGHHRSSLVHAAYRIRHQGWTAERAWAEVAALPWARPGARSDRLDRELIARFAEVEHALSPVPKSEETEVRHEAAFASGREMVDDDHRGGRTPSRVVCRLGPGDLQLRDCSARPDLPVRTDAGVGVGANAP
jgi:protein tyrosine phosphatase (PTP) superfamily phosphohydrolase (DUF442 family)